MNILFLRGFNNYFNRIVKKYSTLEDYKAQSQSYLDLSNINFNPNDGVATELIVGSTNQKENNAPLAWDTIGTPDYAICYEMEGNPASAVIKFRWFVLESERTRNGQYRIALKRDVVAEHFDQIKEAPCFIEKGIVNDTNNSLLYNKENMTYNQIKDAEYQLKDSTGSAWVVGYISKNQAQTASTVSTTLLMEGTPVDYYEASDLPFSVGLSTQYAYDSSQMEIELTQFGSWIELAGFGTWSCMQSITSYTIIPSSNNIENSYVICRRDSNTYDSNSRPTSIASVPGSLLGKGYWHADSSIAKQNLKHISMKCSSSGQQSPAIYGYADWENTSTIKPQYMKRTNNSISTTVSTLKGHAKTACSTAFSSYGSVCDDLTTYNGQIVKYNNNYYQMNINKVSYRSGYFKIQTTSSDWNIGASTAAIEGLTQYASQISNSAHLTNLRTDIQNLFSIAYESSYTGTNDYADDYRAIYDFDCCGISMPRYSITLSPISTETLSVDSPVYTDRNTTYDCPADLFAIPYGEISFKTTVNGASTYYTTKNEALAMARAFAMAYGSSCYDLQLVPYCPSEYLRSASQPYILSLLDTKAYRTIYRSIGGSTPEPCSFMLWVTKSKGEISIPLEINNYIYNNNYSPALTAKINNETVLCRLASPNFNGMFEFSLAKNNGITKFDVDYTYKPYMPYIHVNPDFKFIYGKDWDDARGLICGGDFSLAFINSYWQNYQNNNKNYQQIFDRQIQNMDVNNAIAMEKQRFQAVTGTITGAIGGAIGGAAAGSFNPYTAIAGAVIGGIGGGIAAGIGGQMDISWLDRQQQEAKSYAIDMYGYQLGNIQAMPYSLSRTESLTNNNKIWPILELYKPTDLEVNLLAEKIKYNGMTIMAVGNLKDYCTSTDFDLAFVKGQIIKLENLNDDFHIADAIYQEVEKGFYIPQGGN